MWEREWWRVGEVQRAVSSARGVRRGVEEEEQKGIVGLCWGDKLEVEVDVEV